jgi:hypothetical protein
MYSRTLCNPIAADLQLTNLNAKDCTPAHLLKYTCETFVLHKVAINLSSSSK